LFVIAGAAAAIVAALLLQYFSIWRNLPQNEAEYWGEKYDVFYVPGAASSYFGWLFHRYADLITLPGHQVTYWRAEWLPADTWTGLQAVGRDVWRALHVIGLLVLVVRRRYRELALLALPLLVLAAFNAAGFWPFGVFRTNTFLILYLAGIAATAFDGRFRERRTFHGVVPAFALVVLPLLAFEKSWPPRTKRAFTLTSQFPALLEWLAKREPKPPTAARQIVVLTRGTCDPWRFFVGYHPRTKRLEKRIEDRFEARCVVDMDAVLAEVRAAAKATARPVWVIHGRARPFGPQRDLVRLRRERFDRHFAAEWGEQTATTKSSRRRSDRNDAP
jgi:hypothetical protein